MLKTGVAQVLEPQTLDNVIAFKDGRLFHAKIVQQEITPEFLEKHKIPNIPDQDSLRTIEISDKVFESDGLYPATGPRNIRRGNAADYPGWEKVNNFFKEAYYGKPQKHELSMDLADFMLKTAMCHNLDSIRKSIKRNEFILLNTKYTGPSFVHMWAALLVKRHSRWVSGKSIRTHVNIKVPFIYDEKSRKFRPAKIKYNGHSHEYVPLEPRSRFDPRRFVVEKEPEVIYCGGTSFKDMISKNRGYALLLGPHYISDPRSEVRENPYAFVRVRK